MVKVMDEGLFAYDPFWVEVEPPHAFVTAVRHLYYYNEQVSQLFRHDDVDNVVISFANTPRPHTYEVQVASYFFSNPIYLAFQEARRAPLIFHRRKDPVLTSTYPFVCDLSNLDQVTACLAMLRGLEEEYPTLPPTDPHDENFRRYESLKAEADHRDTGSVSPMVAWSVLRYAQRSERDALGAHLNELRLEDSSDGSADEGREEVVPKRSALRSCTLSVALRFGFYAFAGAACNSLVNGLLAASSGWGIMDRTGKLLLVTLALSGGLLVGMGIFASWRAPERWNWKTANVTIIGLWTVFFAVLVVLQPASSIGSTTTNLWESLALEDFVELQRWLNRLRIQMAMAIIFLVVSIFLSAKE